MRVQPRRFPDRFTTHDIVKLEQLFEDTLIGHLGFVRDGAPVVMPTAVVLDTARDARVLLHGSTGSGWLGVLGGAVPVCLTVTSLDALVVARSAFESSFQYRSALIFGTCRVLVGQAATTGLNLLTERILPGRTAEVRRSTRRELAATTILELQIEEWSLKSSHRWPDDDPADVEGSAWAGVVPYRVAFGPPRPAPDLDSAIPVPRSVARLIGGADAH